MNIGAGVGFAALSEIEVGLIYYIVTLILQTQRGILERRFTQIDGCLERGWSAIGIIHALIVVE